MNIRQTVFSVAGMIVGVWALSATVHAATTPTLSLTNTSGDSVQVKVTGEPSSVIQLSFLPQGASALTTVTFGTTDANGAFSTTISSGGYNIPQNSPVYVTVKGLQSSTLLWPNYTSSLNLSKTSVQIAIGQAITITGASVLTLSSVSASSIVSTSLVGNQITVTGLAKGATTLVLCGVNVGCGSLVVDVGDQGQTQVSMNETNITLKVSATKNITLFGGGRNGYVVSSNSNPTSLYANISGSSNVLSLFGNKTPGTATVVVCAVEDKSNCATLTVSVIDSTVSVLSFNPSNSTLTPGLVQNITISGGPDNSYYISSNSNSAVAQATLSGTVLTVTGGNTAGSTIVKVCSTSVSNTCGDFTVSLSLTSTNASDTVLSFSQNVVSVPKKETTTITISGGAGKGYVISSNSNPAAVTATVNGTNNSVSFYGNEVGSAIVALCSAAVSNVCASVYVNVTTELVPVTFNKENISMNAGGKSLVTIIGGMGKGFVINSIGNTNIVSAVITSDNMVLLTSGSTNGSTSVVVCSIGYTNNCGTLYVSVTGGSVAQTPSSNTSSGSISETKPGSSAPVALTNVPSGSLIKGSRPALYYYANGKRYSFANDKIYSTWYNGFSGIKEISNDDLGKIPLGGNVTYRPGVRMVKITTDPKIYAVGARGELRWIATEAVAKALYGSDWNRKIDDLPDALFSNYRIGAPVNSASDFDPAGATNSASTIASNL